MNIVMPGMLVCISYTLIYHNSYTCMYGFYLWIGALYIAIKYKKHIYRNNLIPKYLSLVLGVGVIKILFGLIREPQRALYFEWIKKQLSR